MKLKKSNQTAPQTLKRQIRQLESIVALSAGIAHDYNNLLTAIMGNISLALEHVSADSTVAGLLEQSLTASRVAQTLTQRLITFSKGAQPTKQPTDIVNVVDNTAAFSLSGSNIRYDLGRADGIWPVDVDPQQIAQAIHNLMINAAESMPAGGSVSIGFENITLDGTKGLLLAGRYVDIAIQDQGAGIRDEHIDKIFDAYFSTKAKGNQSGTGLGLSISHSIITRHGGEISVSSRVGVGTTFHILLPAAEASVDAIAPDCVDQPADHLEKPIVGRGRILVMDDEAMIRELVGNMLDHLGYDADFAKEGSEVLTKYQAAMEASAPYDAVILDLTIKGGMGGQETMARLIKIDPAVKAIVSSGYSDSPAMAQYKDYGFCEVVAKPYEIMEFSQKLHRVVTSG